MSRLIDALLPARRALPTYDTGWAFLQNTYHENAVEPALPTFQSYAQQGYQSNSIVFSVILARLMLFSEVELKFQTLDGRKTFGTDALEILEHPWPGGTTGELLARMEQDASLAGNWFGRRTTSRVVERLRPDLVDIVRADRDGDGAPEAIGYLFWRGGRGGGDPELYDVDEVVHWSPIPDPLAQWRGMSWLTPVVREINADMAMTAHKQTYFENSATPQIIIKYEKALNAQAVDIIKQRWMAGHAGPSNAGSTAILDEGADLTVVGNSMEQMNFTAVQAAGENRIAAAAGVPGIVVGLKEGLAAATYSNYEQAMRRFADLTMRPLWRSATAALGKLVDVPPGCRLWYDVGRVAALRQGEKERAETLQVQAAAALNFINAGYEPDTVTDAMVSGDLSLLKHTGAVPTALYPDGKVPTGGDPA